MHGVTDRGGLIGSSVSDRGGIATDRKSALAYAVDNKPQVIAVYITVSIRIRQIDLTIRVDCPFFAAASCHNSDVLPSDTAVIV